MTDEERFIEGLYEEANEQLKEVYKEQTQARDEILQEIAMIMLTYTILDGLMSIKKNDRDKSYKKISGLIFNSHKSIGKNQINILNGILKSTVNKTFKFYNYNANLKDVKKIIEDNFKGKHFSERIWNNEQEVARHLHKQINDFLNGKINVNQIKKSIEKTFNTSAYNAKRLVETEVNRCSSDAFDMFCEEVGVERVRYNSTLDNRLCSDCAKYHDRVFNFKDKIEVPRHPLCRCFYTIEYNKNMTDYGTKSGALTSKNDPNFEKRDKHAELYYESVRKRNKQEEISTIANNTGFNVKTIEKVYDHIFINKYELDNGIENFAPDYDMAQSWQRLREGKNIKEHDIIMIKHERLEYELMNRYNKKYREAHNLTETRYNYMSALIEYLKKNNLG